MRAFIACCLTFLTLSHAEISQNTTVYFGSIVNELNGTNYTKTEPLPELEVSRNFKNVSFPVTTQNNTETEKPFVPSPEWNPQYEYNKFPVAPALPELKHLHLTTQTSAWNAIDGSYSKRTFPDSKVFITTEKPYLSTLPSNEKWPYPFEKGNNNNFVNRHKPQMDQNQYLPVAYRGSPYTSYQTVKLLSKEYSVTENNQPVLEFSTESTKTPIEYSTENLPKPPFSATPEISHVSLSMYPVEESQIPQRLPEYMHRPPHYYTELTKPRSPSPWKKFIKLFSTLVPIGLLLSALTPNVITIKDFNNTQTSRGRMENSGVDKSAIPFLLSNCDYKELCKAAVMINERDFEFLSNRILRASDRYSKNFNIQIENVFQNAKAKSCDSMECIEDVRQVQQEKRNSRY